MPKAMTNIDGPVEPAQYVRSTRRYGQLESQSQFVSESAWRRVFKQAAVSTPPPHEEITNFHSFSSRWRTTLFGLQSKHYISSAFEEIQNWHSASIGEVSFGLDYSGVEARAINGLLLKLLDQNIDLAATMGELRSTSRFFESTANELARGARKLRNGLSRKGFQRAVTESPRQILEALRRAKGADVNDLKRIADAQLAYQYAIRPVLSDLHGSMEILYNARNNGRIGRFVGYEKASDKQTTSVPAVYLPDADMTLNWVVKERVGCKAGGEWVIDDPWLAVATQAGLTDPLPLVYELAFLSFVIDWVIPVGDFLKARSAQKGWKLIRAYTSVKQEMSAHVPGGTYSRSLNGIDYSGYWNQLNAEGHRFWRFNRTSGIDAQPPPFVDPVSANHVKNGAALLVQLLSYLNRR
jgi:hypothetical protein